MPGTRHLLPPSARHIVPGAHADADAPRTALPLPWGCALCRPQMLHSQETEYTSHCLAPAPTMQLMFAASCEAARPAAEHVTVHSLSPEAGVLAYKWVSGGAAVPGARAIACSA